MAYDLEVEAQRVIASFERLHPTEDLPRTQLNPNINASVNPRAFILALLKRALCPEAVTSEFLTKLQSVRFVREAWTEDYLVGKLQKDKFVRRAINEFVHLWVMKFILPCMSSSQTMQYRRLKLWVVMDRGSARSFAISESEADRLLTLNVSTRESDRCCITGVYDVSASKCFRGPFGLVSCVRILPETLRNDDQAHHLIRVFTGGQINSIRDLIDRPVNAFFMSDILAPSFREFYWSVKVPAGLVTDVRSDLVVERVASRQHYDIDGLPANSRMLFGTSPAAISIPPPKVELCRLHLAVAMFLDDSGARDKIVSLFRSLDEPQHLARWKDDWDYSW
ncbi:hypothetical protein LOZ58_000960 [Ophidiomyces ophidiicola]|nr:hypothetical protein LOZ65_002028 [Ophidiomyces ophidiicola]KAI1944064.1 hypothetical protein LOZ66_000653 [Ophidiomyces ophidiicola]KAI1966058.1 hypothetical protein LOZ58_000960 [Ophidiomyces ophidiicola]